MGKQPNKSNTERVKSLFITKISQNRDLAINFGANFLKSNQTELDLTDFEIKRVEAQPIYFLVTDSIITPINYAKLIYKQNKIKSNEKTPLNAFTKNPEIQVKELENDDAFC